MRRVLGLDIGVNSVGFALVNLANDASHNSIITSGVRIVTEDPSFHGKFYTGNPASKNDARRTKRMIRRLNNRYKTRRAELVEALTELNMMPDEDLMYRASALELYAIRERAVKEQISLPELGRAIYHLNQKRGFLSNRKSQSDEESSSEYLTRIHELEARVAGTTIGAYFHRQLLNNPFTRIKENIFPRKEYIREFDLIWQKQKEYYPKLLTGGPGEHNKGTLYQLIRNEIIYYQRPLKSAKHLISQCRFEPLKKVAPKSSPLFQVFRIWQQINNLEARSPKNETIRPSDSQRLDIFNALHDPRQLSSKGTLAFTKILKLMGLPRNYSLNYAQLEGNKTYLTLFRALEEAGIAAPEQYLSFNPFKEEEKGGLWQLWHITYSLPIENDVVEALKKNFFFSPEQAAIIATKTGYTADFGSLSARAIRKLLPHLHDGLHYDKACREVGYDHVDDIGLDRERELKDKLELIAPNALRNPVVEQVLNQVVNVVNGLIEQYGRPDEIRVELVRELKSNAKKRQNMDKMNRALQKKNAYITQLLIKDYAFKRVNARDLLRYRLWEETEHICLYSGRVISFTDLYNGTTEIEHVLPRSRSFSNSMSNYIVSYQRENKAKGQLTAYDYMTAKGEQELQAFTERVNRLCEEKKISKAKRDNLLCAGKDIPSDFIDRQKKDTQYISREAVALLKHVCHRVTTTTGSVTDFLREKWGLRHLMEEVNLEKYRAIGQTELQPVKDDSGQERQVEVIKDFTKRDDHRHHAVDAIIVALTSQSIIQRLNNLNQQYETYSELKTSALFVEQPVEHLRYQVKKQLEQMMISFKKPNSKVLSRRINSVKEKEGTHEQETWSPRGSLHEDTIIGRMKWYKKVPLDKKFTGVDDVVNTGLQGVLLERLEAFSGDARKAFDKLDKNPVLFKGVPVREVVVWDHRYTKRVALSENMTPAQVEKIVDKKIREKVRGRIAQAGGIKEAFKEYDKHPLYLDRGQQIAIKSVTLVDNGNLQQVRKGFVYTKSNHHAIIYTDGKGNFKERVVPFWEAVERCLLNLRTTGSIYPIIDQSPDEEGWRFYTSLQINDLFVLDVDPGEVDFTDPENRSLLAQNLYRVQKLSRGEFCFRHQYETTLKREESFALRVISSAKRLQGATKVRLNHLGEIVQVVKPNSEGKILPA